MKTRSVFLALVVPLLMSAAQAQSVGIATGTPGTIHHSLATALAKVANDRAGIPATVQPFAAATVYTPAINSGEIPMGFVSVHEASLAYEGKDYFSGRPNKNLRAIAITYAMRNGVWVKKNSPYRKIQDLKGHPAPDGYSSQKILLAISDGAYATAGLTRADFKPVYVPNVVSAADGLATGKLDFFIFGIGAAKVREVDVAVGGLRALSLDNTPESVAAMRKHFPTAYLRLEKPNPENVGVVEPAYCLTYDGMLLGSADASEELIYKITKTLYENKADLAAIFPLYKEFEPMDMAKNIPVPYHPGAIKFYKERGMWPPK